MLSHRLDVQIVQFIINIVAFVHIATVYYSFPSHTVIEGSM